MKVLSLLVFLSLPIYADTALQYARAIESSIDSDSVEFPWVKAHLDAAMNGALQRSQDELVKRGYFNEAERMRYEWATYYKGSLFVSDRDIGDHKPIIQWINTQYKTIELLLGKDVCRLLHISDMLTFNSSNVTVRPCSFPMDNVQGERIDEYRRHFAGGPKGNDYFYGTIPALTYWVVNIGLTAVGVPIVSSLIASVAERLMDIAAANLSDSVYNRFCK